MNADDNDDIPWGTDPDRDDAAPQSESTQPAAGERSNPFLRVAPPAAAAASVIVAAESPAPTVAARVSRPALLTGSAVLAIGAVLVVVNVLSSGTTATAPPVSAAVAHSSPAPAPTSTSVVGAPVVSISRMTATATVTITAVTTATATTRIPAAAAAVTPTTPPRSQPPLGKTIPVPKAGQRTTPPAAGAPTRRLSVLASGSAVPGGVAVTAAVDTDGAPVTVQVHVSGPQGGQQQFAMAPGAAGGGTYSRTVHTGAGVVAMTVSATAGTRSASSAPFTVKVPS